MQIPRKTRLKAERAPEAPCECGKCSFNSTPSPEAPTGIIATHDAVPWINRLKLPHHFLPVGQIELIFSSQTIFVPWFQRGRSSLEPVGFESLSCCSVVSVTSMWASGKGFDPDLYISHSRGPLKEIRGQLKVHKSFFLLLSTRKIREKNFIHPLPSNFRSSMSDKHPRNVHPH